MKCLIIVVSLEWPSEATCCNVGAQNTGKGDPEVGQPIGAAGGDEGGRLIQAFVGRGKNTMLRRGVGALLVLTVAMGCDSVQPGSSSLERGVPPSTLAGGDDAAGPTADAATRYPDGASPGEIDLGACSGCVCSAAGSYCFGGPGTARVPAADAGLASHDGGDADAGDAEADGDAGPPVCPIAQGGAPALGCNRLPPPCVSKPTCACVVQALQPSFHCYLVCDETRGFLVYCPTP
jgi:hypothetical protein